MVLSIENREIDRTVPIGESPRKHIILSVLICDLPAVFCHTVNLEIGNLLHRNFRVEFIDRRGWRARLRTGSR